MHLNLRVLGSQLNLVFAKGACWHQTFAMGRDWLLESIVGTGTNRVSFGLHSFFRLVKPMARIKEITHLG